MGLVRFQIVLAVMLFLPAWSLRFWEGWIYWIVFSVSVLVITLYFLKHDPRLVERRLEVGPAAEPERTQKIIQAIGGLLFCALLSVPGFDHRFHWSTVAVPVVLFADVLVGLALVVVFMVFKENSHTASIVSVEAGQPVVSTGLYRFVRHPMYAGGMLGFLVTPLALGSLWALLVAVPLCGVVIARLLDEERHLLARLPGYESYCRKVRYRLVPGVW